MTSRLELHHEGEIIVVQADDAVLGRRSDCELRVIHPLVSRQHCRFEVRPDGVTLVDLGSANGTYINAERLSGARKLRANDWTRIGTQGPQFQLLRAEVDGEDVSGWDPEAMQETMMAGKPSTDFTVRVSVGPQARAEPDDVSDRSTPSMLTGPAPDRPPSIPVALPLETDSHDIRSSDVFLPPPDSSVPAELGPVLIGPDEDYEPDWDGGENPDDASEEMTRAAASVDLITGQVPVQPDARDFETGEYGALREDETAAAPRAPAPREPQQASPPTAPSPPAVDRTSKPADWPASGPGSTVAPSATATAGASPGGKRRWGALLAGFLCGVVLALAGVVATATFTPLAEDLHQLAPSMRVIDLPEDWR